MLDEACFCFCKEDTMPDFFERAEPIFDLYQQGNYADALRLVDELALEFPDRSVNTSYWRICLLSISGQIESALHVMEQAVKDGLWWSEERLRAETDLAGLQGNTRFEQLVAICADRHQSAKAHTKPELIVLEPDTVKSPLPLLLILHGRDGSADREKHHWESTRQLGWLTAFAQSSQVGSRNAYVWDDLELAHREICEHFKALEQKYSLDASRIVLAGFSQGSGIAITAALRGDIPATAFIAVAPGRIVDVNTLPAWAEAARGRGLHGVIVAGGKDPRFDVFTNISEILSRHDIPCQLEIRPDLGHADPSDFKNLLQTTLQSI
jgi:predicted esterase